VSTSALGFSQVITSPRTVGGTTSGKADVGALSVDVPLSSYVVPIFRAIAGGQAVPTVTVEMCQQGEVSGQCLVQVDLTDALLTNVAYTDSADPSAARATFEFRPRIETVTSHGAAGDDSVTYDAVLNRTSNAGTPPASAGDLAFLTTLAGPNEAFDTQSWGNSVTNASSWAGTGAVVAKSIPTEVALTVRSGASAVELLGSVFTGATLGTATITGCPAAGCTQTVTLTNAYATKVTLGSPLLVDADGLGYQAITVKRADSQGSSAVTWDVFANKVS
jgi:type VI protein secretion system component Hcp